MNEIHDPAWLRICGAFLAYFLMAFLFALIASSPTKGPRRKKMIELLVGSLALSVLSVAVDQPLYAILGSFAVGLYVRSIKE